MPDESRDGPLTGQPGDPDAADPAAESQDATTPEPGTGTAAAADASAAAVAPAATPDAAAATDAAADADASPATPDASATTATDASAGDAPGATTPVPGPSRGRQVLLGVLAAAGLAGAATLGIAGWRVFDQKDATLSIPDQVVGFRRDDSERALATADYLRTALEAAVPLNQVVGAVYQDPTDAQRSVLFFGGTKLLWSPQRDLDTVLDVVAGEAGKITDQREVPPGDLDGVMKCGSTTT
ncbi:MAG TPA: hypothetical protein VF755_20990, partial [Catenuloplanes sp.]